MCSIDETNDNHWWERSYAYNYTRSLMYEALWFERMWSVETSFAQRALCVRWMKRIYDEFDDDELNVIERLNTFIKSLMHEWKHERNALLLIKWIHLTQTL